MGPRRLSLILALSSIAIVLFALPSLAAAAGGSISGTVKGEDTHAGLEGVIACAIHDKGAERIAKCAKTSSTGNYEIVGLEDGAQVVVFLPAEGGPAERYIAEYFDNVETEEEAQVISIAGGNSKMGIDAELALGGSIAGTVFKPDGSPAPGIYVCIFSASEEEPYVCYETGTAGEYEYFAIPSGGYKIEFSPPVAKVFDPETGSFLDEKVDDGYDTQWWKAAASFSTATPIKIVAPTMEKNIDAHLTGPGPPNPPAPTPPVVVTPPVIAPPAVVAPIVTTPIQTKGLTCKRGFRKTTVKGKAKCVRKHKKAHKHAKGDNHAKGKARRG